MTAQATDIGRLCIHQVTLMQCGFRDSIECLARHGVSKTAVWRDKLEEIGAAEAAKILDGEGVEAVSLCAGGMLTAIAEDEFRRALDDNRRWIGLAADLGATSLVTITGGLPGGQKDLRLARARAMEGLAELLPVARSAGIRLALEPLHPMVCGLRSVISTISEAEENA